MITRFDIEERVREWGLAEQVVEKDYVLGWVLWGIGSNPLFSQKWAFKGGTCLKKCYLETYRFSEDLDFTVLPDGPLHPEEIAPELKNVLQKIQDSSGIDFSRREFKLEKHPKYEFTEGRIYYVGPRQTPGVASIKLDLSRSEKIVRPTEAKRVVHAYPDGLPEPATVVCYSSTELFSEKIRALGDRCRPRDLYDIVNMYRRDEFSSNPQEVRAALAEKCQHKQLPVPTYASITTIERVAELKADWDNMLGHQLPSLPPVDDFLSVLGEFFQWLEGSIVKAVLPSIAVHAEEPVEAEWRPPPTVQTWGGRIPIETIRYAAVNRLCVELGYKGTRRIIEPYSLRRTRAGNLILCAVRVNNGEDRAYRVDRIESVRLTNRTFSPKYRIEFTTSGQLSVPRYENRSVYRPAAPTDVYRVPGVYHVVKCNVCGRLFYRHSASPMLNEHKRRGGGPRCLGSGTYGTYIGMRRRK